MEYKDRYGKLGSLKENNNTIIELGPGTKRKYKDSITIDRVEIDGVDIVANLDEGFSYIPDNSVDLIYSRHVLEHVLDLELIFSEVHRILKPGGGCHLIVPHFSNPYYYSDYTHKSFWGLYTICYFSSDRFYKRTTPSFYQKIDFEIIEIDLLFKSPFYFRNLLKKVWQGLFNSCKYMQELYEENFSQIIPCYEINIRVAKKNNE